MQNARRTALCLTLLFLIAPMMPLATAASPDHDLDFDVKEPTISYAEPLLKSIDAHPLKSLELLVPKVGTSSGRAACPSPSTLQSDGGSSGDAGADATTSRSLGTNPNSGTTGAQGCVDATDTDDWYTVTTTAGKDVDVELVVPAGADFDLYLVDSTGYEYDYDWSEYDDPLEKVSTGSTSFSGVASTFYINVRAYTGDGQYTLRTWTNNTPPRPDLVITSVIEPATAQAGDTVSVEYVVENIYNTTSDAFEVQFILSSDRTYDQFDTLLDVSEPEAALAENTSRTTVASVTLPSSLSDGSYYWIVWADGYNNLTEYNDTNNNLASDKAMLVGDSCQDYNPNGEDDAGLGADAPNNESAASTPLGTNVTDSYTGCIDGREGNDVLAFDVPANHNIEAQLTMDQTVFFTFRLTNSNDETIDYVGTQGFVSTKAGDYDGVGDTYFLNITRSGTAVNWTLDVWTNYSTPEPNLIITNLTAPTTGIAGTSVSIDVQVNNTGSLLAPASTLSVWLSVDAALSPDWDLPLGNYSVPSIDVNQSETVQFSATIPAGAPGGNYSVIVMADSEELISEKSELDNEEIADDELLVNTKATACPSQDDAGSGADAGEDENTALLLGEDVSMTITGCVHEDVDAADWFEIVVSPGLNLTVTMVNAPDQDADVYLRDSAGEWFERGYLSGSNDETISTADDATYAGTGGTFYISVDAYLSLGVYTLIIETEGVDPNSFNCGQQNDLGIGQDAPAGNGIDLGTNPSMSGEGCFSGADDLDIYAFSISDSENFDLVFEADTSLPFTVTIQDAGGNLIASADNTSYGMVFQTLDTEFEGQTKDYTVVVDAAGAFGLYNLSINTVGAAPADVAISTLVCPLDHTSGEEVQISWELVSLRGPGNDASIVLHIDLLDDMGAVVSRMVTTTSTVSTQGNLTFGADSEFYTTPDETTSGNYTCRLTIDVNDDLVESDEENNVHIGDSFFIQNEEELWANDVDRDGFNTTDSGDGIVDDCPTTFGESTIDRFGCADIDEDGVSNLNDFWPLDASQALDSDLDSFGDNPLGTEGDQCPDVPGVAGGEGGDGCPAAIVDADGDGVLDADDDCPNTPTGTTVGTDGCEVDPTDGTTDNGTDGGNTTTDGNTTTPGDNTGDGNTDGTTDGTEDNTDVTDVQSDSTIFGMSPMIVYALVGLIVVGLVSALLLRGRNSGGQSSVFAEQQKAYDASALPAANDSTITAEQLAYEQQLIAAGYPADAARTYADQHFRPYLNN
jgi:hypothetical protein